MRGKTANFQLSSSFRVILLCNNCSSLTAKLMSHHNSKGPLTQSLSRPQIPEDRDGPEASLRRLYRRNHNKEYAIRGLTESVIMLQNN